VAPFDAHLIDIPDGKISNTEALKTYETLKANGVEVLWDDRGDVSAGVKFADADLIGIPVRLVVSEKLVKDKKIEWKKRESEKKEILSLETVLSRLK
jgi:prolyl-tRNA synthetase